MTFRDYFASIPRLFRTQLQVDPHHIISEQAMMDTSLGNTANVDCDILFEPPNLSVLLLNCSANKTGRIDRLLRVKVRDICTAYLVLYNKDTDEDELLFVLDLRSNIYKEKEEIDNNKNLCSVFYQVERDGNVIQFEVIPTSADGIRDVQAFDFILGQYAMKDDSLNKDGIICEGKDRNPNVVAQGFESTGMAVRVALRSGGLYTGHAIRYLGQQYTSIVSAALGISGGEEGSRSVSRDHASTAEVGSDALNNSSDSPGATTSSGSNGNTTRAAVDASAEEIERANNRRKWAEGVHSAATSVTGAVLYPVRWTGRVAAELGGKGGSDRPNSENAVSKVFLDTVGGIGNGMMSVCKGVTEAIGEVGSAIGDSAMHHSVTVNGSEYAETVTKCYVDAASELGLAGYKVANVATLGWQGVLVNAALEGTTFLVSLYEYLMGPVLLQGYMEMMQMPMLKVERFFVVLRPWSIAFYRSAADITGKPYKVVATSMLDTLPKLRIRTPGATAASPSLDMLASSTTSSAAEVRAGEPVSGQKLERGEHAAAEDAEQEEDFSYWHRSDYEAFDSGAPTPTLKGAQGASKDAEGEVGCCTSSVPAAAGTYSMSTALDRTKQDFQSAMTQLAGGATSHIELCTVDCSTFILYPPSDTIHQWFHELSAATGRVETIAKRKSGADEIALYRRLDMYPITSYVTVKVKRFVRTTPKPSMFDMFIRKRSALNTGTVDDLLNQELEKLRPDSGASVGAATDSSPVADAKPPSPAGNSEEELQHDTIPIAQEVGNLSDDDDIYECDDFWIDENPDLLSGSYLEIIPEDHDRPDVNAYPMLPSASSDGSPSPVPPSITSSEALEGSGVSSEGVSGTAAGDGLNNKDSDSGSAGALRNPPLPLSSDVTNVSRAFFAPEVQCSIYPVMRNGTILLVDKHRIPQAPLMTVQQYLAELQSMISALSAMIAGSMEEPVVALANIDELRNERIQQLENLRSNYDTYALVNPEKLISDWEVYNHLMGPVEVGRSVNIFSSKDVSKLEIKLNRRHSQISHFSEWGLAEIAIQDIPPAAPTSTASVNGSGNVGAGAGVSSTSAATETWVPVFRRSTGEQLGVLLVEICRFDL